MKVREKKLSQVTACALACAVLMGILGAGCAQAPASRPEMDLSGQVVVERNDQAVALADERITGVPGSPSATATIDGKQLPPPPQKFEGKIGRTTADSKPYWPARVVPPKGAPNILLIMTDDAGYGVASTFGGVIPTPALDRI